MQKDMMRYSETNLPPSTGRANTRRRRPSNGRIRLFVVFLHWNLIVLLLSRRLGIASLLVIVILYTRRRFGVVSYTSPDTIVAGRLGGCRRFFDDNLILDRLANGGLSLVLHYDRSWVSSELSGRRRVLVKDRF